MLITANGSDQSVYFHVVQDASNTSPGEPRISLDFEDISTAYYVRDRTAPVEITPVTLASAVAAHTDGGFVEVNATNMPGLYRFDIPDAVVATGSGRVIVQLVFNSSTNALAEPQEIEITAIDLTDSVRGGMTALPNADVSENGGLIAIGTGAGQVDVSGSGLINADTRAWAGIAVGNGTSSSRPIVDVQAISNNTTGASNLLTNIVNLDAPVSGCSTPSQVNVEVADVMKVDASVEPVGPPEATASMSDKINWIFMLMRNRITQNSSTQTLFADDATTSVSTAAVSDAAGTFERSEWADV